MNFREWAKSANHAQRNWLDGPIPIEDVNEFIEIARSMPTKQNIDVYKLIASTNKEFNTFIYNNAVDPIHEQNKKYDHGGEYIRNSMVLAPLLFIYIIYTRLSNPNILQGDAYIGAGISSGAVALAAAGKGYKTGFCSCLKYDIVSELKEKYNIPLNLKDKMDLLALGIGKPNPGIDHNVVIRPEDNEQFYVETHPNNPDYHLIK